MSQAQHDLPHRGLGDMVRASVHYVTTDDELDRFAAALAELADLADAANLAPLRHTPPRDWSDGEGDAAVAALWRVRPYLRPYRVHIAVIVTTSIISSAGHGRDPADRQVGDRRTARRRRPRPASPAGPPWRPASR